jgi:hypothetical protein
MAINRRTMLSAIAATAVAASLPVSATAPASSIAAEAIGWPDDGELRGIIALGHHNEFDFEEQVLTNLKRIVFDEFFGEPNHTTIEDVLMEALDADIVQTYAQVTVNTKHGPIPMSAEQYAAGQIEIDGKIYDGDFSVVLKDTNEPGTFPVTLMDIKMELS